MLSEMLEIVLTLKILGSPKSGALGLRLFSLMVNPRLVPAEFLSFVYISVRLIRHRLIQWFYTYHLGVRGAKAGGAKHQSLQGYTLWNLNQILLNIHRDSL